MMPDSLLMDLGFDGATVTSLHTGISETFRVAAADGRQIIIKQLREERGAEQTPQSEMAWLEALAVQNVPCVRPYFADGRANSRVCQGSVYSFYRFVSGDEPDRAVIGNYTLAGRMLRRLHDAGQAADLDHKPLLQQRPVYDVDRLVRQFYPVIRASDLFAADTTEKLLRMGREIEHHYPRDRVFVHGDYHFGNLLQSGDAMTILDFDECGFGARCYDTGTMLLHTMSATNPAAWNAFLDGYGCDDLDDADLKYGAAARIFYMIGKVPERFHVPDVAADATGIIERYTNVYLTNVLSETYF